MDGEVITPLGGHVIYCQFTTNLSSFELKIISRTDYFCLHVHTICFRLLGPNQILKSKPFSLCGQKMVRKMTHG